MSERKMSMAEFRKRLEAHGACNAALRWLEYSKRLTPEKAILACLDEGWLSWLAEELPWRKRQMDKAYAFWKEIYAEFDLSVAEDMSLVYYRGMLLDDWDRVVKYLRSETATERA